jgi:hypothetical protein
MLGSGYFSSNHNTIASESGSQKSSRLITGTLPPDFAASLARPWNPLSASSGQGDL